MKARLAPWLCAGLLAAVLPLAAQQPPASPRETTAARIERLLRELDSPRFAVRERAQKELGELEEKAFLPLKKAVVAAPSCEFKRRAEKLLERLAIYEPGGEVVGGLKLRLTADRDKVKPGETVKLTTAVCNMTDKPVTVQVGYSYMGHYFECGARLRRVVPAGPKDKGPTEVSGQWQVGFCGTGARPLFATVPPKSLLTYTAPATVIQKDGKTFLAFGPPGRPAGMHYLLLETPGGAAHALRVAHEVAPEQNRNPWRQPGQPAENLADFWSGKVRSNDVQLTVTP
jgi:hypothetical protein